MLDVFAVKIIKSPLNSMAMILKNLNVKPDQVTIVGFGFGLVSFIFLWLGWYKLGLVFILVNRVMDGLDGALARITEKTDAGGFLDICLDFIFYSLVIVGFALSNPQINGLPASVLIFSYIGTGSSFLAFAVMAQKYNLKSVKYPHKSIYYIGGLTEGTETIILLVLICLFPAKFPILAYGFAFLCFITTTTRIVAGYTTLKEQTAKETG